LLITFRTTAGDGNSWLVDWLTCAHTTVHLYSIAYLLISSELKENQF